jgi:hypothetical protein
MSNGLWMMQRVCALKKEARKKEFAMIADTTYYYCYQTIQYSVMEWSHI